MPKQTALTTRISKTRNDGILLPERLTELVFLYLGWFEAGQFEFGLHALGPFDAVPQRVDGGLQRLIRSTEMGPTRRLFYGQYLGNVCLRPKADIQLIEYDFHITLHPRSISANKVGTDDIERVAGH